MASNSVPRLKVYRLDSNYSEETDDDVRSMTNDELLPVVAKNLNPFSSEEMSCVRMRQDARVVGRSGFRQIPIRVKIVGNHIESESPVCCEGWVMGKGNMRVYVYRGSSIPDIDNVALTPSSKGDFQTYTEESSSSSDSPSGEWIEIDRRFWDYNVESKKTYILSEAPSSSSDGESSSSSSYSNPWHDRLLFAKPSTGSFEIHEMDWMTFKLGNMLTKSNRVFTQGYEISDSYIPIATEGTEPSSGYIIVQYKKYCELGDSVSGFNNSLVSGNFDTGSNESSNLGVQFGDVYNGNKNGRCLHTLRSGNSVAVNILEGDETLDTTKMNYYEGNYLYKRKIYPFRVKVLQSETLIDNPSRSEFVVDNASVPQNVSNDVAATYEGMYRISNGKAIVPSELSWFMDDMMKPVVFERITVDEGTPDARKIFKQLTKKQVNVQYQNTRLAGDHYVVTLVPNYYLGTGTNHVYPDELFFVYNYVDDSLGNVFDFNYDYASYVFETERSSDTGIGIGYGYANNGGFDGYLLEGGDPGSVYIKREIIAMAGDAGRDASRELLLEKDSEKIFVRLPSDDTAFTFDDDETAIGIKEKSRLIDALINFSADCGIKLYVDGNWICTLNGTNSYTASDVSINGINDCTVTYNDGTKIFSIKHANVDAISGIVEIMLVYYEKREISFHASSGANPSNPFCIGYRVPCYEKVKSSTLFVSSFPNWLKGHVNNDLDIFYGNTLYSGTEVKGDSVSDYHDIYPEYVKDGWYAMYSDGAVEFNEAKTEVNYFDVMNYTTFAESSDDSSLPWDFVSGVTLDSSPGSALMPNYWADAKKMMLYYKKVRYNVAHIDGIYSVTRGRLSNYSNKNGISRYALLEDDDNPLSVGKRWVGREDSVVRRMIESGRDELPKTTHGVADSDATLPLLYDTTLNDHEITTIATGDDRISTFLVEAGTHVVFSFGSVPTETRTVLEAEDNPNLVRVHAKVGVFNVNGVDTECIAFGLEREDGSSSSSSGSASEMTFRERVFSDDTPVDWVVFDDLKDAYVGNPSDNEETYLDVGINSVETDEITIDGVTMKYWYGSDEPSDDMMKYNVENGYVPVLDESGMNEAARASLESGSTGKVRRYRYHGDESTWGYDVFFEVFSYRYNIDDEEYAGPGVSKVKCVEVAAYRVATR